MTDSDWTGVALGLAAGAAAGHLAWLGLGPVFGSEVLQRTNFRDRKLPVAGGLALLLAVLLVGAIAVVAETVWRPSTLAELASRVPFMDRSMLVVVLGFGLLGFVDDVVGSGAERGFRGHLGGLARGRLTAGGLKLFGGGAVALVAVHAAGSRSVADLLRDAVLVALAANLANLLDLAPGRVIKFALIAFAILAVARAGDVLLRRTAVVVGAAIGLFWPDLRERVMLGDTGANPLGAAIGLGVVLTCSPATRLIVVAALLVLNVVSEFVSFSRVISAVMPLRVLDEIGRIR